LILVSHDPDLVAHARIDHVLRLHNPLALVTQGE
jgi:hypothetical protein